MRPVILLVLLALAAAEDAPIAPDVAALRARAGAVLGTPDPATIDHPDGTPPSPAIIDLGRTLFFDPRLSADGTLACATCHNPDLGWTDGLARGRGVHGTVARRNTPAVHNLAWTPLLFWDGRADSLEAQALGPIQAPGEMAMDLPRLLARLNAVPGYRTRFTEAYGAADATADHLGHALAAFERTLVVRDTPYDRWQAGDDHALGPEARRGLALFLGKADCTQCHSGPNFTDGSFHRLGLTGDDLGRAAVVPGAASTGAFKTPGLRNVARTAPYFHDGSQTTLEDVVRFYDRGGDARPADPLIRPLHLTDGEVRDLVAFLGALTGSVPDQRPELP